nr:MAG: coat protein [Medicago sativa alphapartitivirus 2]
MDKSKKYLSDAKEIIKANGLEEKFLAAAGLSSMDELDPKNFAEFEVPTPSQVMKPSIAAAPITQKPLSKQVADASTGFNPESASDMLRPFIGLKINYKARKTVSTYAPSSLMMDYILHQVNNLLVDNFYFRRACPDYHPYILRLYYGVLFWIQCMRAMNHARLLHAEASQCLSTFLDAFPADSLPISSPLLDLFKTLCCSQPEIPTFGVVSPTLPFHPGPEARSAFMLADATSHVLPNIPGIFALIENLRTCLNPGDGQQPNLPAKGKHIPVTSTAAAATVFGHHQFPILANRSNAEKWSLCSSGLQYPCEADRRLHENFSERLDNFEFPVTAEDDDLRLYSDFLHITHNLAWFAQVRDVAANEAAFFNGSGTLADCPPFGIAANQITAGYLAPIIQVAAPTRSADPASLFPFAIKLETASRALPELAEAMAALAQTNVNIYPTHPYYNHIGAESRRGPFWNLAPVESSITDHSSYLSLREVVRGLMKPKG